MLGVEEGVGHDVVGPVELAGEERVGETGGGTLAGGWALFGGGRGLGLRGGLVRAGGC